MSYVDAGYLPARQADGFEHPDLSRLLGHGHAHHVEDAKHDGAHCQERYGAHSILDLGEATIHRLVDLRLTEDLRLTGEISGRLDAAAQRPQVGVWFNLHDDQGVALVAIKEALGHLQRHPQFGTEDAVALKDAADLYLLAAHLQYVAHLPALESG